ncbi:MAG: uncharacterized protein QOI66_2511 [Myxococcales bacterium]|jgi:uncharacterized membrane protein YedE/YeeE|nr:uncharacterized protein [Myxococcales bacterium]
MTLMEFGRAILGGTLIGAAATVYWRANGRVAGVSGILRGALVSRSERTVAIPFLVGLVIAGLAGTTAMAMAMGIGRPAVNAGGLPLLGLAGLLVGLGTRISGGCTSGHGVCGLARFSRRALAATLTFIATGALTVFVVSHWLPALRAP